MRRGLLAMLLGGSLLVAGCKTVEVAVNNITKRAGDDQKIILGLKPNHEPSKMAVGVDRDLANRRAETIGMISSPDLTRHLNAIHTGLVEASGVKGVPGKVYVAADLSLNAVATPDGNIYVDWGLLRYLESEDAIAAIIAHELSHVLLNHNDSSLLVHYQKAAQWYQQTGIATSMAIRGAMTNSTASLKKGERTQIQDLQTLVNVTGKVIMPIYQRSQEREADLLGLDLMVKAGYNPDGMSDLMSIIKQGYEYQKKEPNPVDAENLAFNVAAGSNEQKLNAGLELLAMKFGSDQPAPQTCLDDVGNYLAQHYDPEETSPPYQRKAWESTLKSQHLRRMVAAYDGAHEAKRLIDQNKPLEACAISKKYFEGAREHAYPAFIHAITLWAIGRNKEAEETLAYAMDKSPEPSGTVYVLLAESMSNCGNHRAALGVIAKARTRLGDATQRFRCRYVIIV